MRVRTRGDRAFGEIPPSEVVSLGERLKASKPLEGEAFRRAILEFYGIRRMTANVQEKLMWIESNRDSLLGED